MRTIYPIVVAIALIVAWTMISLSGFAAVVGQQGDQGVKGGEKLNESADKSPAEEGVDSSVLSLDNPLTALITTAIDGFVQFSSFVLLLPINLQRLGFPGFFALPVGVAAQFIVGIGVFQAISGRTVR
jgi:uncharacterized protein YceK